MDRHVNDEYVKKAKVQSYRSRAAFKLLEINDKHNLLKGGMRVIDVGAAPGGWSQVIASKVKSKKGMETVVAVDLLQMLGCDGVKFIQGDIESEDTQEAISKAFNYEKADLVCSDAVPDFIGDRFIDHMKACFLNNLIVQFCEKTLKPGGTLLMKIIQGPSEQELHDQTLKFFRKTIRVKPSASRQQSAEIYYLCLDYDNSLDEAVIRTKKFQKRLQKVEQKMRLSEEKSQEQGRPSKISESDQGEVNQLYKELEELSMEDIKRVIKEAHANGQECK